MIPFVAIYLLGVFISAVSQVMLKKAAMKEYDNSLREYLNPLVVGAYILFLATTLMTILAYKVVPLSLGPILEATAYLYVAFFGVVVFKETVGLKKIAALALIIAGIVVYSVGFCT